MRDPRSRDHEGYDWSRVIPILVAALLLTNGCGPRPKVDEQSDRGVASASAAKIFRDFAPASGLKFVHFNGMSGHLYFVEPVGPGGALFDYDNDGDLDIYLVQGAMLPADRPVEEAQLNSGVELPLRDRLFRNDLVIDEKGQPTLFFSDVTVSSGIDARGYGMGVAVADFDNDGWNDLYVTNFGPNQLWRNNGDGTFSEVAETAGAQRDGWSTSSSWFDFDRDGWLDLFVTQYVDFRLQNHKTCRGRSGRPDYCGPQSYNGLPDMLLRNRGDGTFEDFTQRAGLLAHASSGLGVISDDFDRDGWMDLYVANDLRRNFLWMNQQDGSFVDRALLAGVAVSSDGKAEASMGVAAADVDNDGDDDIFITHLMDGTNTLYRNDGQGQFEDQSRGSGLGMPSLAFTGFGTTILDYDNDGWLDVVTLNGSVFRLEELILANDPYPLGQRNQLFHNQGDGSFEEVLGDAGDSFGLKEVSRGLAVGDVDNDGDSDVLQLNNHGPARLLINQAGHKHPWIGFRLETETGRDALGARILLKRKEGPALERRARTDGSYCSANDPRVLFGLGESAEIDSIQVFWPKGRRERFGELDTGQYHTLVEGTGVEIGLDE